jgi:hypothetical protein
MFKLLLTFLVLTYSQLSRVEQARHLFLGEGDSYRALKILERLEYDKMTEQEYQEALSLGKFISKQIGDTLRWGNFNHQAKRKKNQGPFLKNQLQLLTSFKTIKRVGNEILLIDSNKVSRFKLNKLEITWLTPYEGSGIYHSSNELYHYFLGYNEIEIYNRITNVSQTIAISDSILWLQSNSPNIHVGLKTKGQIYTNNKLDEEYFKPTPRCSASQISPYLICKNGIKKWNAQASAWEIELAMEPGYNWVENNNYAIAYQADKITILQNLNSKFTINMDHINRVIPIEKYFMVHSANGSHLLSKYDGNEVWKSEHLHLNIIDLKDGFLLYHQDGYIQKLSSSFQKIWSYHIGHSLATAPFIKDNILTTITTKGEINQFNPNAFPRITRRLEYNLKPSPMLDSLGLLEEGNPWFWYAKSLQERTNISNLSKPYAWRAFKEFYFNSSIIDYLEFKSILGYSWYDIEMKNSAHHILDAQSLYSINKTSGKIKRWEITTGERYYFEQQDGPFSSTTFHRKDQLLYLSKHDTLITKNILLHGISTQKRVLKGSVKKSFATAKHLFLQTSDSLLQYFPWNNPDDFKEITIPEAIIKVKEYNNYIFALGLKGSVYVSSNYKTFRKLPSKKVTDIVLTSSELILIKSSGLIEARNMYDFQINWQKNYDSKIIRVQNHKNILILQLENLAMIGMLSDKILWTRSNSNLNTEYHIANGKIYYPSGKSCKVFDIATGRLLERKAIGIPFYKFIPLSNQNLIWTEQFIFSYAEGSNLPK